MELLFLLYLTVIDKVPKEIPPVILLIYAIYKIFMAVFYFMLPLYIESISKKQKYIKKNTEITADNTAYMCNQLNRIMATLEKNGIGIDEEKRDLTEEEKQ